MSTKQIEKIHILLKQFRRRMILHDTVKFLQTYLWITALAMVAIQITGRISPINHLLPLTLMPIVVFMFAAGIYILFIPRSDLSVAWRVDRNLYLKERISSAIAFEISPPIYLESEALFENQREDALEILQKSSPRNSFRVSFLRRKVLAASLIFSVVVILVLIPNPMDEILRTRGIISQTAQEQAEEIEEMREEIEATEQLSEEEREALLRELEELANQLRENRGDQAEALEDISRLEQALLERLDLDAQFKQAAIESISEQLTALAKQTSDSPEDITGLEEALETLAGEIGEMSETDRQSLSIDFLKLASQAAQAGVSSLAEALSAFSQAAQIGSVPGTQQSGEQTQQAINDAQTQISDQQSLEAVLAQLQNSRQAFSQVGQPSSAGQSPGADQVGQGQSQGSGQSQGQGQGQGQGPGNTPGGGGTDADSLPPATSSGRAGEPQRADDSSAIGSFSDQVFSPWDRQRGENDSLSISGQDTGQGQTQVNEQDQPLPGIDNPSIVPYQEVFQNYQDTVYQTIEESYIPVSLKTYILEYFSKLEP
jgi:hypothetical protein